MTILTQITQYAISGTTSGSIYAIVGVCWSIVFLVTGILNFTTGEFLMLGGMFIWFFLELGYGLVSSSVLSIAAVIICGILIQRLLFK